MSIHFFVMDVDGTLTDGKIYMSPTGEIFKAFDIKDGYAIKHILPQNGIIPVVITARESQIVEKRCKELSISECYQGSFLKLEVLNEVLHKYSTNSKQYTHKDVLYVGDDLPDLECMQQIKQAGGLVACPKDAAKEITQIADYISTKEGGKGAVREIIEWLMGC